jgi:hypothetical protein
MSDYTGSKSFQGVGAQLSIGAVVGGSGSFTPIFEITTAPLPEAMYDKLDVTNLNSVVKEYRKGLADYGEIKPKGNLSVTDPGQLAMAAAFADLQNPYQFKLEMPKAPGQTAAGDTYTFSGLVMGWTPIASLEATKTVEFQATIQIVSLPLKVSGS